MTRAELLKKYHQVTAHLNKTNQNTQGQGPGTGPGVAQSAWEYPHYHSNFNAKHDSQGTAASNRSSGGGGESHEKTKETSREPGKNIEYIVHHIQ